MAEHGTRTNYRYGCRCDACREAHNAYYRQTRYRTTTNSPNGPHVRMACYCGRVPVWVPEKDVLGGKSRSCGRKGCQP